MRKVETLRNWRPEDSGSPTEMGKELRKLFLRTLPDNAALQHIWEFGRLWNLIKREHLRVPAADFMKQHGIGCSVQYADRCGKAFVDKDKFIKADRWFRSPKGHAAGWQVRQNGGVDYAANVVVLHGYFIAGGKPEDHQPKKQKSAKTLKGELKIARETWFAEKQDWKVLAYRAIAEARARGAVITDPLIDENELRLLTGTPEERAKAAEAAMFEQPIEDGEADDE